MNKEFIEKFARRVFGQPALAVPYWVTGSYNSVIAASAIDIKWANLDVVNGGTLNSSGQPYYTFYYGYLNVLTQLNTGVGTFSGSIVINVPQQGLLPGGLYETSGGNMARGFTNLFPLTQGNFFWTYPSPICFISLQYVTNTAAASSLDATFSFNFHGYRCSLNT